MGLQLSTSVIIWNFLAPIILLSDVAATGLKARAAGLSLSPNPPVACETLTIGWPLVDSPFYSIIIHVIDVNDQTTTQTGATVTQTEFEAFVFSPTASVEWQVRATGGASLQLFVYAPTALSSDVKVQSGSAICPALVAVVCDALLSFQAR